ncbi:MAG: tetratricopeptide repeat protein [Candidatus Obscuribacterales bacterium]|nr:tetratricopeptide repeat protein [Candidatus Obscuribacterales bacterium]
MNLAKAAFLCMWSILPGCVVLASPLSTTADPYEAGVRYYNARNYKAAAHMFETAMRLNPAHSSALYYDALCYQHLGETEHARALHHHVVNIFPTSPAAALAQQALSKMGAVVAASATKPGAGAPAAAPGTPPEIVAIDAELAVAAREASSNHGELAERAFMDAERKAERLGRVSPKLAQVLGAMGDYFVARGEPDKACKAFKKELQVKERLLDRNSMELADCMSRHATAFLNDGQADEAERLLTRSVEAYQRAYESNERNRKNTKVEKDKWAGSLAQLANCYRKMGKFSEAKQLDAQVYNLNNAPQN